MENPKELKVLVSGESHPTPKIHGYEIESLQVVKLGEGNPFTKYNFKQTEDAKEGDTEEEAS